MCIVTNISKSDCLLVLKDSSGNVIAEFNATETTFAYSEYTFTIKDYRNTYEIKLDDVTLINGGIYTTFDLLYTYLVGLRTDCRCECGGGGGGSAIWGDITGDLSDQTDLQTALDGKQDDLTDVNFGAFANGLTGKTTPLDADLINIVDTADTNKQKKVTFANVKSFLKTYFDTIYQSTSLSAYSFRANNTNTTANGTDNTFKDIAEQVYSGSITWTATTAPSGATNHSYRWSQVGKLVTLRLTLIYANAGVAVTSVTCGLPPDCPVPEIPSGSTANGSALYNGSGTLATAVVGDGMSPSVNGGISELKINSGGTGYEIKIYRGSAGYRSARATIQYYSV